MWFVAEVAVRLVDMQIEISPIGQVPQFLPIDAVLDLQLHNGLSGASGDDIHVSPHIRNLSIELQKKGGITKKWMNE